MVEEEEELKIFSTGFYGMQRRSRDRQSILGIVHALITLLYLYLVIYNFSKLYMSFSRKSMDLQRDTDFGYDFWTIAAGESCAELDLVQYIFNEA